jgi:translation elongation factor EF-Ts
MADSNHISELCKKLTLLKSLDSDVATQTIEEGIKYVISKTQENCRLNKVYQRAWSPSEGEVLAPYLHNPKTVGGGSLQLGKVGALVFLKADDKAARLDDLASQLALHVAAMKPHYLFERDVPQEVREKAMEEAPQAGGQEAKKKALEKLFSREVFMEQELATSDEPLKIKELFQQKETELKTGLHVKEWALFNIGA